MQDACPYGHATKAALQYFRFFALYNLAAHQLTKFGSIKDRSSMVNISGYHILEQLYNGSITLVYPAIRENDSKI
ncbi:MAG: hypothetical protein WBA39_11860 [Rivularia sp. (in: cyanobacteria)]